MGLAAIIIALLGLMWAAYKGWSVILVAPIFALVAALGSDHSLMPTFSELYMTKAAEYFKSYYAVFLFGAIFAKIMEKGGLAASIANKMINALGPERAIMAVILTSGVLVYGGLNVFVAAFVMYPFGAYIFKKADIPKRLLPSALWIGIFTFSMVSLPGTPQIQNIIPATYFGTNTWSGMGIGIFASVLYLITGWAWIIYRVSYLKKKGEGYGLDRNDVELTDGRSSVSLPDWRLSLLPMIMVVVLNVLLSNPFNWNWGYHWDSNALNSFKDLHIPLLADAVVKVQGVWSITIALALSTLAAAWVGRKQCKADGGFLPQVNSGAVSSCSAVLNVCSGFAFGSVLTSLSGFEAIKNALIQIGYSTNPLISMVLTTDIMVGITGSASSAMTIGQAMLGTQWMQMAAAAGIPLDVLHRIIAIASIGIDPVPQSGAWVTLLAICGLTHKESYGDVFILLVIKFFIPFACILFYMLTGIV